MRKTLLIAAAALAASVISSEAQVYSQNIVGYVNQTFANEAYVLTGTPLQVVSNINNAELVLPAIQGGDSLLLFNGAGFDTYTYLAPGSWLGPVGVGPAPTLNAGAPFFYLNSSGNGETNTFVGSVTTTNSETLPNGYELAASVAPVAGPIDSTNFNLPFQGGDSVLLFNGNGYDTYTFLAPGSWLGPVGVGPAPSINVAEAFFYQNNSGSSESWNQNLVIQ
jgi:hypothetical protein